MAAATSRYDRAIQKRATLCLKCYFLPIVAENINKANKEENNMQNEKKVYETPAITFVQFDASDRITASACSTNWTTVNDGTCTMSRY